MAESLPYVVQVGTLKKAFDKIKAASTPDLFNADYLGDTLGMKGGNARAIIPFLKKAGFLSANGAPTDLYRQFRNPAASRQAMREALQKAYAALFAKNENVHKLTDPDLKGLVLEATGLDSDSRVVSAVTSTFKLLKSLASFDGTPTPNAALAVTEPPSQVTPPTSTPPQPHEPPAAEVPIGMNLSYTINLNLPSTPDINVFNAIFRSLRENLLKR